MERHLGTEFKIYLHKQPSTMMHSWILLRHRAPHRSQHIRTTDHRLTTLTIKCSENCTFPYETVQIFSLHSRAWLAGSRGRRVEGCWECVLPWIKCVHLNPSSRLEISKNSHNLSTMVGNGLKYFQKFLSVVEPVTQLTARKRVPRFRDHITVYLVVTSFHSNDNY